MKRRAFLKKAAKGFGAIAVYGPPALRGHVRPDLPRLAELRFVARDPDYVFTRPCFSPSGDRILFMGAPAGENPEATERSNYSEWSLWTVPADGGSPTLFYDDPEVRPTRPDWSWTSGKIVFTGMRDREAELWVIDEHGGNPTRIHVGDPPLGRLQYPCWYPDGRSFAVTHYGSRQILKVDTGNGEVQGLTDPTRVWAGMCSVSPDGEAGNPLAFAGQRPGGRWDPRSNVIWMQYPGQSPFPLDGEQGRMPWWSPSGERMVLTSNRSRPAPTHTLHPRSLPGGNAAIFVQRPRTSEEDPITLAIGVTPYDYQALHAKWSPDGRQLVCAATAMESGERGIATVDLDL